jgi:cereblon
MNSEGPQGAYVNPDGFVHDTLTVRHANNLVPRGVPSARFSWFPGYKWVCVFCHSCFAHVGWHFEAADGRLAPHRFWGLTRKALITMPHQHDGDAPAGSNLRPVL